MHQNWPPSELSHPDPGATLAGRVSPHLGPETQEAKPDDHQDDDEAMKFLDLGLLSLSYDLCEKRQFASLFATFGKNIGFEGFASLKEKIWMSTFKPPRACGAGGL